MRYDYLPMNLLMFRAPSPEDRAGGKQRRGPRGDRGPEWKGSEKHPPQLLQNYFLSFPPFYFVICWDRYLWGGGRMEESRGQRNEPRETWRWLTTIRGLYRRGILRKFKIAWRPQSSAIEVCNTITAKQPPAHWSSSENCCKSLGTQLKYTPWVIYDRLTNPLVDKFKNLLRETWAFFYVSFKFYLLLCNQYLFFQRRLLLKCIRVLQSAQCNIATGCLCISTGGGNLLGAWAPSIPTSKPTNGIQPFHFGRITASNASEEKDRKHAS